MKDYWDLGCERVTIWPAECDISLIPLDHGKENSVQLNNMSGDSVLQAMEKLVTSGSLWDVEYLWVMP